MERLRDSAARPLKPTSLVSPGSFLFPKPHPSRLSGVSAMDKSQQPSSFQQLEKVRPPPPCTPIFKLTGLSCSLVKAPMPLYVPTFPLIPVTHVGVCRCCPHVPPLTRNIIGLQRTQSPDGRDGGLEGNPPGFRRRNPVDCDSRDFLDEGAET